MQSHTKHETVQEKSSETASHPAHHHRHRHAIALWAWLGGLLGIGAVAFIHYRLLGGQFPLLIGSFGASAVLIYGAIDSPLAQPRNLIGGHLLSAFTGVCVAHAAAYAIARWPGQVPADLAWTLAAAVAVATAIALMQLTGTLHPPGGATALIAVAGGDKVLALGFLYPFVPVTAGALALLVVALVVNNLQGQKYPKKWW